MSEPKRTATDLPTAAPTPKVLAGSVGASVGVATADLLCWALEVLFTDGQPLPVRVSVWIALVVPLLLAFLAGYFTPRSIDEVARVVRRDETP